MDKQFMIGEELLVTPVLNNRQDEVNAYFPKADWWVDFC